MKTLSECIINDSVDEVLLFIVFSGWSRTDWPTWFRWIQGDYLSMHDLKHLCINVSRFVLYPLCYLVFPSILRCDKLFKQFLTMIVHKFDLPNWITKLAQSKIVGVKWKQNRNYYVWFKTSWWSCFWPWPLFQVYYLVCKETWCYIWFRPVVREAS